ncbi:hypothetical protein [Roseovarius sp. MMSF_3281]|uniref:hypothetical protein n=1 Tax=Roseovarius sp. MMSF_3281 TaxID=3046694 RepID=UPI0035321A66
MGFLKSLPAKLPSKDILFADTPCVWLQFYAILVQLRLLTRRRGSFAFRGSVSSPLLGGYDVPETSSYKTAINCFIRADVRHKRDHIDGAVMESEEVQSTVLGIEEGAMIVAFRRHSLLPLDVCLYIPHRAFHS